MDAVGAVGRAGRHLVQEHDVAAPLLDPQRVAGQARQLRGQRGQLVEVGGEQAAAAVDLVQMLDHRPGQRQAVIGGGAAADLVQDHEAARPGQVQDAGGLDHLDHEGRAAAREVVGGADAGEQPVDHADMGRSRRHEAAHLGQHRDQRVLAQEGALAGHVRPGQQPQRGRPRPRSQSLATKLWLAARQRLLDHRVAAATDQERVAVVDHAAGSSAARRRASPAPRVRSSSAKAAAVAAMASPSASTRWRSSSNSSSSRASARSAAVAILLSSSASSAVL